MLGFWARFNCRDVNCCKVICRISRTGNVNGNNVILQESGLIPYSDDGNNYQASDQVED